MNLPRFSPVDDQALKRFRFQAIFIAFVWGVVAALRTAGINHSGGVIAITVVLWIICIGFLVTSALAFVEVSRRKAESLD